MKKLLIGLFVLLLLVSALLAGAAYFAVYQLPTLALRELLNNEYVSTESLEGNVVYGFQLENMQVIDDSQETRFRLGSFHFRYNGLWSLFRSKEFIIEDFTINDFFWKLPTLDEVKKSESKQQATEKVWEYEKTWTAAPGSNTKIERFAIDHLLFQNIRLEGDFLEEAIVIERFLIEDFDTSKDIDNFTFDLKSNFLDLGAKNFQKRGEAYSLHGTMKPDYMLSKYLKAPFDFSIQHDPSSERVFDIRLLQNSFLFFAREDGSFSFQLNDFSPADVFIDAAPVRNIKLQLQGKPGFEESDISSLVSQGEFSYQNQHYEIIPAPFFTKTPDGKIPGPVETTRYDIVVAGSRQLPDGRIEIAYLKCDPETPGFVRAWKTIRE